MEQIKNEIPAIKRGQILLTIQKGKDLEAAIADMTALQLRELRNFLEEEIKYLSHLKDEAPLELSDIKSKYEPGPNYYYKNDCREPLESCLNETCFQTNQDCFSRKMRSHIEVLSILLEPYLHN
jgi:hypothetical protein